MGGVAEDTGKRTCDPVGIMGKRLSNNRKEQVTSDRLQARERLTSQRNFR